MSLQNQTIALQGVGYGNAETAAQGLLDAGSVDATASLVGQQSTATAGTVAATGAASAVLAGVQAASSTGVVAASGAGTVTANVSGVQATAYFGNVAASAGVNVIEPIGGAGYLNGPSRERMAELARKQRRALGILPAPMREQVKRMARSAAKPEAEKPTVRADVRGFIKALPAADRMTAMRALQDAADYYAKLQAAFAQRKRAAEQAKEQAAQEIARIQQQERETALLLEQIAAETALQVEEADVIYIAMQLLACID